MCSQFLKRMENYEGDLADIVRATASTADGGGAAVPNWQFPGNPFVSSEDFGDPFTYMLKDPLMHNNIDSSSSGFFFNPNINQEKGSLNLGDHDDQIKRPPNIFSRMLQISPSAKPPVPGPPAAAAAANGGSLLSPHINRSLVDSPGLQISSPRNTGIKRRKSQAKKVVCIPAPAPANSRSTGEVVPSDLWAWRKYGQKPIKGSPYPRGYYRCSSSKGCSARKQVERSRTDPNMLVITYTSEHNHPWPTQRNALAGSTRSQPSKNTTPSSKNSSPNSQTQKPSNPSDQEHKESSTGVKEEMITDQDFDNQLEMDEADRVEEGFPQTYKPTLADSIHSEDSFFADLGEIEVDPLNLLFTQGFSSDDPGRESNDLDPFCFYDWATSNVAATTTATVRRV